MSDFLFWLAAADVLFSGLIGLRLIWASRTLRRLVDVPPAEGELPRISIVVAARNEQRNIEPALESLLKLDYENLEIIVVNDRSTDETPAVLDRIAARQAELLAKHEPSSPKPAGLRVIHLDQLPPGWLGKNHALFRGAKEASGEYLLFTDADIVMHPTVLRRAIAYVQREQVDHLAVLFRVTMPSWLMEAFGVTFSVYFLAHFKPWKVRDPNSSAHIGVGGFNLIRAAAYHEMGSHQAIAMRPDDDLKLGKLVKKNGFRQDLLLAPDLVTVPWYSSLGELIVGLEKNAFAGVDYNIPLTVASSIILFMLHFFPFVAVFFTTGATQLMFAVVVLMLLTIAANAAHQGHFRLIACLGFPLAVLLFVFIQWRTMILNLWEGGIRWRDTFYPLAELKANKI